MWMAWAAPPLTERFERATVCHLDLTVCHFMSHWVRTTQTCAALKQPLGLANRKTLTFREQRLLRCAGGPCCSQPTRMKPAYRPTLLFGFCHQAPRRTATARRARPFRIRKLDLDRPPCAM